MLNRTLIAFVCLSILLATGYRLTAAPAPAKPKPARIVVGLKDPLTPEVIAELKNTFGARIVNFVVGNTYALVLLRPGETLASVQSRSKRIVWVEPEVAMGAAREPRLVAVIVPAPTAKEAARERRIKARTTRARLARAKARAARARKAGRR